MTIMLRRLARQGLLLLAIAASAAPGHARQVEGQTLAEQQQLGGTLLELNGVGVRAVAWLKGYVAGLYLSEKAASFEQIAGMAGPKRVQLRMLRNASADDFNAAIVAGIRKNASPTELAALNERVETLVGTIRQAGSASAGDVINFDYQPDVGTVLTVNGVTRGAPIAGQDFYMAILSIFVGNNPVDAKLKKGLLGQ